MIFTKALKARIIVTRGEVRNERNPGIKINKKRAALTGLLTKQLTPRR